MNSTMLYKTTDVIDTYITRAIIGMGASTNGGGGNITMAAAVGLMKSVIGFFLVMGTNIIVRRINPDNALF